MRFLAASPIGRRVPSRALAATLAGIVILPGAIALRATPGYASAARPVGGGTPGAPARSDPAERMAALVAPSMALVETTFTAELTVSPPTIDPAALSALETSIAQSAAAGAVGDDQSSITQAVVSAIAANPLTYLIPTSQTQTQSSQVTEFGTGWFVTPDGYLVTPDHVVAPSSQVLDRAFEFQGLVGLNSRDAQELATGAGGGLSAAELSTLDDAASAYNEHFVRVSVVDSRTTVQPGNAIAGISSGTNGYPARVLYSEPDSAISGGPVGSATSPAAHGVPEPPAGEYGTGLAVLKIDGVAGMATIPISVATIPAPSATARPSSPRSTYTASYPISSDFGSSSTPLSHVSVQAVGTAVSRVIAPWHPTGAAGKPTSNTGGPPAVEIGDPLTPGAAGGAVLDDSGDAVAMVIAPSGGQYSSGSTDSSLAVPSLSILDALRKAQVNAVTSPARDEYARALPLWFSHYYRAALPYFEQVSGNSPDDPFIARYLSQTRAAIASGDDRTPISLWSVSLVVIFILIAIRFFVVPSVRISARRKRHALHRAQVRGIPRLLREETPELPEESVLTLSSRRRGVITHGAHSARAHRASDEGSIPRVTPGTVPGSGVADGSGLEEEIAQANIRAASGTVARPGAGPGSQALPESTSGSRPPVIVTSGNGKPVSAKPMVTSDLEEEAHERAAHDPVATEGEPDPGGTSDGGVPPEPGGVAESPPAHQTGGSVGRSIQATEGRNPAGRNAPGQSATSAPHPGRLSSGGVPLEPDGGDLGHGPNESP